MRKLLTIILLFIFISSILCILTFSAEEPTEEKEFVSYIYDYCGPELFLVLDSSSDSLSEEDRIALCVLEWRHLFGGPLGEYKIAMDRFKKTYKNLFGNDYSPKIDQSMTFKYHSEEFNVHIEEDGILAKSISIDAGAYKHQNIYFLKDYELEDNNLYVTVGIRLYNPEDESLDNDLLTDMDRAFFSYESSCHISGEEPHDDLIHWKMIYFQDTIDRSLWNDYSEYLTLYTMKFVKEADGNWHWDSCYLYNPDTADNDCLKNVLLLTVSGLICTIILFNSARKHLI